MRDWRTPLWTSLAVLAVAAVVLFACTRVDGADVNKNEHARACAAAGHTIKEHEQWGGKWRTSTWWCVDSDKRITDIWFERN